MRLLIVEDDHMIGESLQHVLQKGGAAVDWVRDGQAAEDAIHTQTYDLILLDLGLPKLSGIEFLEVSRKKLGNTPVLIVTAQDEVKQRVAGLDAGADDYLIKPFALEELEARIRALLRRKVGSKKSTMASGNYILDTIKKRLTFQQHTDNLSAKEFALVSALLEHPGSVMSRSQLEEKLYAWDREVSSNAVEVHVHQLRKKFGKDVITNVRNLGYMMERS